MITVVTVESIRNEENVVVSIAVFEAWGGGGGKGKKISKMTGPRTKGNTYHL